MTHSTCLLFLIVACALSATYAGELDAASPADEGARAAQGAGSSLAQLRASADAGDGVAQFAVARRYEMGRGVARDEGEALRFYRLAAAQGIAGAQTNLGLMYDEGRGVAENDATALEWFRKAAAQGEPPAIFNLGAMYNRGDGVPKDAAAAVGWWRKGAALGHAESGESGPRLPARPWHRTRFRPGAELVSQGRRPGPAARVPGTQRDVLPGYRRGA